MPTTVTLRVSGVDHTTVRDKNGVDRNYVVLKGYDETNKRGFKKNIFATTKTGEPTQNALNTDSLVANDWVELMLDDSQWENVQTVKKIGTPAGATAPSQTTFNEKAAAAPAKSTGGKSFRTPSQLNREVALRFSTELVCGKVVKIGNIITMSVRLEDYLVNGVGQPTIKTDRNAHCEAPVSSEPPIREPGDDQPVPVVGPQDDDIPF